jgi:hypothetical protein
MTAYGGNFWMVLVDYFSFNSGILKITHCETMKGGGDVYSSLDVLFHEEYDFGTGCFKFFFIIATKVSRNFFHFHMLAFI